MPPQAWQEAAIALTELERLYALRGDTGDTGRWGHFAVLARRRDDLDALHSLCRERGIPVQRMDEKPPIPLHSSREGANLLNLLRGESRRPVRKRMVLRANALGRWFHRHVPSPDVRGDNPFLAALTQFIAETQATTPEGELLVDDLIDDLYEFDVRVKTAGTPRPNAPLLLLTAHRAKGQEFDHVLILDAGGWQARGDDERRLFYVAMTRARQTLTLCEQMGPSHPFVPDVQSLALRTRPTPPALKPRTLHRVHTSARADVYLSWSGRLAPSDPGHNAIAVLQIGDDLTLLPPHGDKNSGWKLANSSGQTVGLMSAKFEPPSGRIVAVRVAAIHVRKVKPSDIGIRRPCWEVVLPEIEYCVDT